MRSAAAATNVADEDEDLPMREDAPDDFATATSSLGRHSSDSDRKRKRAAMASDDEEGPAPQKRNVSRAHNGDGSPRYQGKES